MNKRFLKGSFHIYGIACITMLLMACVTTVRAQEQNNTTNSLTETVPLKYNVLKLSPIAALDIGFGFGLGYERLFGKDKNFGLTLPFYLVLENTSDTRNSLTAATSKGTTFNTYFYFMPGFKFYPGGHKRINYALGPSLLFGFGNNKTTQIAFDALGKETFETVKYARKRFGVLMNNYVTFGIGKAFDLGLEGGLGICYFDRESYNGSEYYPSSSESKGFDLAGQFSLSISYKF